MDATSSVRSSHSKLAKSLLKKKSLLAWTGGLLIAAGGCGNGVPAVDTTTEEATVKGVITVHGKPATKGTITFNPSNYRRVVMARSAEIGSSGEYSIKTLVGQNIVVLKLPGAKLKGLEYEEFPVKVQSGDNNTFDLKLPQDTSTPEAAPAAASGSSPRRRGSK